MTDQVKSKLNDWIKIGVTAIIVPILAYCSAILIQIQKDIIELKIEVKSYQLQINELKQEVKDIKYRHLDLEDK